MVRHERFFSNKTSLGILVQKFKRILNRLLAFTVDNSSIKLVKLANPYRVAHQFPGNQLPSFFRSIRLAFQHLACLTTMNCLKE
jgi:hypothetical protein